MLLLFLTLVLGCAAITVALWTRRSPYVWLGAAATATSVLAVISGFTIGYLIAPIAMLLLTIAVMANILREQSRR
jgi:hypothetical protein